MVTVTQTTLNRAVEAAKAGAAVVLKHYRHDLTHTAKGPLDFVTDADIRSEIEITERLSKAFPSVGIFAEEYGWVRGGPGRDYYWLVDPLCGTVNFGYRIPLFCVNVALMHEGRPVLGVMMNPLTGSIIQGSTEIPTHLVSNDGNYATQPSKESHIVALDFAKPPAEGYTNETLSLALDPNFGRNFLPRSFGTGLAMGFLAIGRIAGFVAYSPGDVHFAAGVVLCRQAGCMVTDLDGSEWVAGAGGIIAAADKATHLQLMGTVRGALHEVRASSA
ncbi:MAG: inositol monophosphatase [Dehalococcoidia bacterium]|nr:inositol monophosphatase [Dehalococcoidia bacterium]